MTHTTTQREYFQNISLVKINTTIKVLQNKILFINNK